MHRIPLIDVLRVTTQSKIQRSMLLRHTPFVFYFLLFQYLKYKYYAIMSLNINA